MPTQYPAMINFYMIRHPDEPKFRYVGSTAHSIEDRLKRHKADMLRGKNCRSAVILKRYPDAQIEIVDERMCNDIAQRNKIEGSLIKCFKSVNHIICGRTPIQYEKYRKPKRDEEGKTVKLYASVGWKCMKPIWTSTNRPNHTSGGLRTIDFFW